MNLPTFIWRSAARHRRRTLLTMTTIALALFVMASMAGVVQQIDAILKEASPLRLVTRHATSLANPLPERYRTRIERVAGVQAVAGLSYFGGIYIDSRQTDFAQFACDTDDFFTFLPEIKLSEPEKQAFLKDRTAVVVGRAKAAKHGWRRGDRITLQGVIYPVDLELTIRGIFNASENQEGSVYFHRTYLEEALGRPGIVGAFWILAASDEAVPLISRTVDEIYASSEAPTKTETEKAFNMSFISMIGNLKGLVLMLSGIIIFTILLVTANTMAMSVRERIREIAILKAIGFERNRVLLFFMAEGCLLTLAGGLAGLLGAHFLFGDLDFSSYSQGFFQKLVITPDIIITGLLLALLVGIAGTGIPAWRAVNRSVADGLRHVG